MTPATIYVLIVIASPSAMAPTVAGHGPLASCLKVAQSGLALHPKEVWKAYCVPKVLWDDATAAHGWHGYGYPSDHWEAPNHD